MNAFSPPNVDFANYVKKVVGSMPAARWIGFAFARLAPGEVDLVLPFRPELTQHDGLFQGAVVGAMADFAGASAAGTLLPAGWALMTADYTVKLLAPAKGNRLIARGAVVRPSSLLTVARADVFSVHDGEETLCATALVTTRNFALPAARS